MPWIIRENDKACPTEKPWGVHNQQTDDLVACHPSRDKAVSQLRALYANTTEGKSMIVETKEATADIVAISDKSPTGSFDVILSTDALDRDGERLYADEWKQPLPEHITFDSDHNMSVASTVGSGKPFINEKGQLQVRGTFASTPHAQTVRTLVNEGHINTVSVAFRPLKNHKDGKPQREVLNAGFVVVPANPEAVVLSSKSADKPDDPAPLDVLFKAMSGETQGSTLVQMIHDAACHLGADCADAEPDSGDTNEPSEKETPKKSFTPDNGGGSHEAAVPAAAVAAEQAATTAAATPADVHRAMQRIRLLRLVTNHQTS